MPSGAAIFGELRQLRIEKRIGVKELARTIGWEGVALTNWEMEVAIPSVRALIDSCEGLGFKLA
jgi:transcriptional regulator with XRE-family HTH domain